MKIGFELDDTEVNVTPIKVVEALIDMDRFSIEELKEMIAYLSVYTRYNNHGNCIRKHH